MTRTSKGRTSSSFAETARARARNAESATLRMIYEGPRRVESNGMGEERSERMRGGKSVLARDAGAL